MVKVIVDTSVLIDHLKNRSTHFLALINEKLSGEIELLIPYIAIIELYAGEDAKQKKAREAITKTLEGTSFIDLTLVSAQKAGELMRVYKQIPDPLDLIIAAIAIEQEAQVATHNKKHFEQIRGLKIYNFPVSISSAN